MAPLGFSAVYLEWTLSTELSLPGPWQAAQDSAGSVVPGKNAVLRKACAAASRVSWQPRQAAVPGPIGLKNSRGATVATVPTGGGS